MVWESIIPLTLSGLGTARPGAIAANKVAKKEKRIVAVQEDLVRKVQFEARGTLYISLVCEEKNSLGSCI